MPHAASGRSSTIPSPDSFKTTGLPFTFAGRARRWITTPAPLYGQHTDEVLTDLLGKSVDDIADTGGGRRDQPPACGPVTERPSARTLRAESFGTRYARLVAAAQRHGVDPTGFVLPAEGMLRRPATASASTTSNGQAPQPIPR